MKVQSAANGQSDPRSAGRSGLPLPRIDDRAGSPSPLLVQIDARDGRVRLKVDRSRPTFVGASESEQPDLAIRFAEHRLEDVLLGRADPFAVFRDAEVADGGEWIAPLPAVESELPANAEFELVPGATLVAALHVTSTLCGDVGLVERWRDGRLIASELVAPDTFDAIGADLRITLTVSLLAALRRREITPADALAAGARLQTVWPYMACYFGLIQHAAYAEAYANVATVDAQVAWGRLVSDAAYREALVEAMRFRSAA